MSHLQYEIMHIEAISCFEQYGKYQCAFLIGQGLSQRERSQMKHP